MCGLKLKERKIKAEKRELSGLEPVSLIIKICTKEQPPLLLTINWSNIIHPNIFGIFLKN